MTQPYSITVHFTVPALVACLCYGEAPRVADAGEERRESGRFVEKLPPDMVALMKQREADQRRITIREANLFHRHFIDTCMEVMPRNVTLGYSGILATDDGRHPARVYGIEFTMEDVVVIGDESAGPTANVVPTTDPGGFVPLAETFRQGEPLHWGVGDDDMVGVFRFWISTQHTKQTLAKCKIEGRKLFVNVDLVKHGQSVDAKLPELEGRSVREVLKLIEKPGPEPGLPDYIKPLPSPQEGSRDNHLDREIKRLEAKSDRNVYDVSVDKRKIRKEDHARVRRPR
ncbi:MAG: hypothetical protein ACYTG0_11585 [Planctomycetota bacterium]|jgi:hypothetical protein